MPNVLPTIPNDPPQGIQALLDKVYLWNPDVSNDLIEKINALLAKLGDESLPDQTDNAGKFLMTDGENISWGNAIKNEAEDPATDIEILTTKTEYSNILIGGGEKSSESVKNAIAIGSKYSPHRAVAGANAIAIGRAVEAKADSSIALGFGAGAWKNGSIAIGNWAQVSAEGAIQLNARYSSRAENNEEGTFKVCLGPLMGDGGNYKLLDVDGTIPTDRYTTTPTDAGTYVPKLTIAEDGTATREWGAESGGGDYLPLSGGTLTGTLVSNVPDFTNSLELPGFKVQRQRQASILTIGASLTLNCGANQDLSPLANGGGTLGYSNRKWANVYTIKLNNGADITVPNKGGTLARVEDITEAVGDISTALTSILGE